MKHIEKVNTSYKNKKLQADMIESVKNADEDDLRVLLTTILLEGEDGCVKTEDICDALGIGEEAFAASLKYWRGAGLITVPKKKSTEKEVKTENKQISQNTNIGFVSMDDFGKNLSKKNNPARAGRLDGKRKRQLF